MTMQVSYWERRDSADRESFGRAALNFCRATRVAPGIRSARFYWHSVDTVVVQTDAESPEALDGLLMISEVGAAVYALSDQARHVRFERWAEAGVGEQNYRRAQAVAAR
jgi:phenylalanine-4-hydroxylase